MKSPFEQVAVPVTVSKQLTQTGRWAKPPPQSGAIEGALHNTKTVPDTFFHPISLCQLQLRPNWFRTEVTSFGQTW
jgi:hypothetical protein